MFLKWPKSRPNASLFLVDLSSLEYGTELEMNEHIFFSFRRLKNWVLPNLNFILWFRPFGKLDFTSFSRCLNEIFSWRNCSVKALVQIQTRNTEKCQKIHYFIFIYLFLSPPTFLKKKKSCTKILFSY